MTTRDEAIDIFSDLHKEVHGFRPRWGADWTLEEIEARIAELQIEADAVFAAEREREAEAVKAFEAYVLRLIAMGAGDRETAVRWMHDAEDTGGRADCLCWAMGLPYGYLTPAA